MLERDSYVKPFAIGEVLEGGAVGVVVRSDAPTLQEGDLVWVRMPARSATNPSWRCYPAFT
jgi:NADPH-dependent curcumin reductase CurA